MATSRVIFRSIEPGDRRKLLAESNDAASGGGARDFRFNYKDFKPIVELMFPAVVTARRRRKGVATDIPIRVATLMWRDSAGDHTMAISFEPPTDARPAEGRIPSVNEIPPLDPAHLPPATDGEAIALFVQDSSQPELWAYYVSEKDLKRTGKGAWNRKVAEPILRALATRKQGRAATGWIDLVSNEEHIHGG